MTDTSEAPLAALGVVYGDIGTSPHRQSLLAAGKSGLRRSRHRGRATAFFHVPPSQVVESGEQVPP